MKGAEHLLKSLEDDLRRLHKDSKSHKRLYRRVQTFVIVLTGATTVVAGAGAILPYLRDDYVQFAVLALSATTAAVTAWLEMRRARELWQHEREMYYQLYDIQREIKFYSAQRELTPEEEKEYFERISSILGASMSRWLSIADGSQKNRSKVEGNAG